jgi:hypothetical protein
LARISTVRTQFAVALTVGVAVVALAACGETERSPEAYCRAFYETAAPIRSSYVEADESFEQDPVQAIATLLSAPGDMVVIFDSMANHAPDDIRPDTEAARDALKQQQESMGDGLSDPLGALGKGLVAGLTASGSFSRVDSYLNEHCPLDSQLAQGIIGENP